MCHNDPLFSAVPCSSIHYGRVVQDIFRLLDQREQEKMEWEWLAGGGDGRSRATHMPLNHGLVRVSLFSVGFLR